MKTPYTSVDVCEQHSRKPPRKPTVGPGQLSTYAQLVSGFRVRAPKGETELALFEVFQFEIDSQGRAEASLEESKAAQKQLEEREQAAWRPLPSLGSVLGSALHHPRSATAKAKSKAWEVRAPGSCRRRPLKAEARPAGLAV